MVIGGVAAMSTTLVADIGGSKSRFALSNSSGVFERMLVIDNDMVAGLDAAVARYLEETGARPRAATLAVAGPIGGEEVVLTNRPGWRLRRGEFAKRFGFLQLRVLNDFEAIGGPCRFSARHRRGRWASPWPCGKVSRSCSVQVPGWVWPPFCPRTAAGMCSRARAGMLPLVRRKRTKSKCLRAFAGNAAR